ncbi:capreomycidine synthase [Amycolatopsis nivea]
MDIPVAKLEEWMRSYYHAVDHDIGSSGVRDLTVGELAAWCGFDPAELGGMVLHDSESFGGSGLRHALADRWTGGDVAPVMVTHGSSEAIYLVMHLVPAPGDEIVVLDPAYQQLYDIAAGRGCRLTRWRLRPGNGFRPDFGELRELVRGRPRMIVVNFPHNPTGVSITPAEQDELVAIAAECGAWLVWDNAFGEMTYPAAPLALPRDRYERCVCFGTLSKSYGLAGLRVGWCVAPPALLDRMAEMRDYIALYVSPVLEFFAEHAVRNADRIVSAQRRHAARNRRTLLEWAAARPESVRVVPPDGGVSAFVEFPRSPDVRALCRNLAEKRRVLLVPGDCFGEDFGAFARLGFGGTAEELEAGLDALAGALSDEAAAEGKAAS